MRTRARMYRHICAFFYKKIKKVLAHIIDMRIIDKARPRKERENITEKMVKKN